MKGISFIEQHVEKLVVSLLAIIFLAVLALQFVSSPNRVSMGGEQVDPGEIEGRLRAKADSIRGRLAGGGSDEPLIEDGLEKVADQFVAGLDREVSPRRRLPSIDHGLAKSLLPEDVSTGDALYHVPRFAPLAMVDVRQESATIQESVIAAEPDLKAMFAASADVTWSIPVASVDLKGLRAELRASPGETTPIPELWYNDSLYLIDLVFERQELAESGWGEAAVVPPLPGAFSLRKELDNPDAVLRDEVFRLLGSRERALAILQPEFLATEREVFSAGAILGDSGPETEGESQEVSRIRRSLAVKQANLSRVEADLKELGGPLRGPDDKDRKRDGQSRDRDGSDGGTKAPGGGMGFGSGTTGGKRGTSGSSPDDEATRAKRRLMTGQLDRLTADVKRLAEQLERLAPDSARLANAEDAFDLAKADSMLVWGHDLGVKPGATYRYRVRLEIYNPFFARKRQLATPQADLAEAFTLRTAVSEWSDPVSIEPEVALFLVDAGPGEGRLGLGSAKFELFRYEDGERRRETFVVQPGERIGDSREVGSDRRSVDFGTEWFVVDVVEGLPGDARSDARTRNARVLISDDQGRTSFRSVAVDGSHPNRRKFNDQVEDARLEAMKPTDADRPADGGAPPMTPAGGPAGGGRGTPAGN
jgi:hypothetical protein